MKMSRSIQYLPFVGAFILLSIPNTQAAPIDWQAVGGWAIDWGRSFFTFLIFGLLAIWLIPKPLGRWSENVRRAPLKSFGVGILVLIAGYAGILILFALAVALVIFLYMLTFNNLGWLLLSLGLPAIGLSFGILSLFVAFVSKIVVMFFLGKILLERAAPKALAHNIWPLLVGIVVFLLIRAIPWLGWVIGSLATLVGLGAIWLGLVRSKVKVSPGKEPAEQPVVEAAPEAPTPEPAPEYALEVGAPAAIDLAGQPVENEVILPAGE